MEYLKGFVRVVRLLGFVLYLMDFKMEWGPRLHVHAQGHNQPDEPEPVFLSQLPNVTVSQGRDVSFTCVVNNLGQYKVAWIKSDSKAILGIHTHMVSLNPRLSVTHNGHNTWKLHVSHVQLNDSGSYMCQVNTDPMRSQSGYLDVVVPPDILNHPEQNLEENLTNEGGTITLVCTATGVPMPTVQWRREGGKEIILRTESREKQVVKTVEGERLVLGNVHRTDMGGYLCIASNGVPPSVSKRFDVHVNSNVSTYYPSARNLSFMAKSVPKPSFRGKKPVVQFYIFQKVKTIFYI
uniref:Ig-like domain-containing protein n=1 Tax=Stomoxys calcitrans TaxID=35570 RepID=A0A1I8NN68_STOCA